MGGRGAGGDKIQWDKLNQPWFDRIVETLLLRKFRSVAEVEILDGRGGDGGRDVSATYPDGRHVIYQLKYYPEGMSGGHRPRRTDVKKSFRRAVNLHEPQDWILVTPRNYSDPEMQFLRELPDETPAGKRAPKVQWIGRAGLDQMLIDFPEVDRWLTLDHVKATREVFEWERRAFLDSPASDLARRLGALGELVDATDPDWTWDFERREGLTIQTLRAQHDEAATRSPISITFTAALGHDFAADQEIRRSIEYGSPERVEIPGSAITEFDVSGPKLMSDMPDPDLLVITSLPADDVPAVGMLIELRLIESGETVATEEGTVTKVHRGTRGVTTVMSFCSDRLTVKAQFTYQSSPSTTTFEIGCRIEGLSARAVSDLLRTVSRIRTSCEVQLYLDGRFLARYGRPGGAIAKEDNGLDEILEFADDLASVLEYTRQNMTFPKRYTALDRVHARVARLLIDGYVVASPLVRGVTAKLADDVEPSAEIRSLLTLRRYARWQAGPYLVPIAGRTFDLGQCVAVHPESWIENGVAAFKDLEQGEVNSGQLVVRPGDDPYFFAYLSDSDLGVYDDRFFAKWDLDGVEEPWLDRPWLSFENLET